MALKRGRRSVRFSNVANIDGEKDATSSSSDVEYGDATKVRKMFSTKRLIKETECFDVDNDHIYSAVNSHELNKKRKIRKMSEETEHKIVKTRCFSKNAIMARLNRERKKAYISTLENENESLREQNNDLKKKVDIQNKRMIAMKREIIYLKGVLANSKELGQILRNLQNATSLPVTSSVISKTKNNNFIKFVDTNTQEGFQESKINKMSDTLVKFPMIYEDINLGSAFDKSLNCDDSAYVENSLVKDESDSFPFEFNENFLCTLEDTLNWGDSSFYSNASDPDIGICLHVNQKRISVEVCSVCSNKANLCSHEYDIGSKIGRT